MRIDRRGPAERSGVHHVGQRKHSQREILRPGLRILKDHLFAAARDICCSAGH